MKNRSKYSFSPGVARTEALTDGIFAISMTILVLNIEVPSATDLAGQSLNEFLLDQWVEFFNYALSFVLLAMFWITHHKQLNIFKQVDQPSIWINIVGLMFVALIPFSTSLMGEYSSDQIANVFFEVNMLIIGMAFYSMWTYATAGYRLVDSEQVTAEHIRRGKRRNLVIPVVSLIAIAASFISPSWSTAVYMIIPLIMFVI